MTLSNIKNYKGREGFTLVELLIVIVVIAILAAITIVAYNGVQDRAHDSAAHDAAGQLNTKIQSYYTVVGTYPSQSNVDANTLDDSDGNAVKEADLGNLTDLLKSGAPAVTVDDPLNYQNCKDISSTSTKDGAVITYYQKAGAETIKLGDSCS